MFQLFGSFQEVCSRFVSWLTALSPSSCLWLGFFSSAVGHFFRQQGLFTDKKTNFFLHTASLNCGVIIDFKANIQRGRTNWRVVGIVFWCNLLVASPVPAWCCIYLADFHPGPLPAGGKANSQHQKELRRVMERVTASEIHESVDFVALGRICNLDHLSWNHTAFSFLWSVKTLKCSFKTSFLSEVELQHQKFKSLHRSLLVLARRVKFLSSLIWMRISFEAVLLHPSRGFMKRSWVYIYPECSLHK